MNAPKKPPRYVILEGETAVQIDYLQEGVLVAVTLLTSGEVRVVAMRSHGEEASSWDNAEFETSWGPK